MSAWSTTRDSMRAKVHAERADMLRAPSEESMVEAGRSGGTASGVRGDLSRRYAGPDDPQLAKDLADALANATAFAERHRGRIASLSAAELARALDELEALQEPTVRAGAF